MAQQFTTEILNAALENLTAKRQQIDAQITEIKRMLGSRSDSAANIGNRRQQRRPMSAAGRQAIADAQRRRWAASKGATEPAKGAEPSKAKRKLSSAGRRAIVAALKKRWAAKRAEGAKA